MVFIWLLVRPRYQLQTILHYKSIVSFYCKPLWRRTCLLQTISWDACGLYISRSIVQCKHLRVFITIIFHWMFSFYTTVSTWPGTINMVSSVKQFVLEVTVKICWNHTYCSMNIDKFHRHTNIMIEALVKPLNFARNISQCLCTAQHSVQVLFCQKFLSWVTAHTSTPFRRFVLIFTFSFELQIACPSISKPSNMLALNTWVTSVLWILVWILAPIKFVYQFPFYQ